MERATHVARELMNTHGLTSGGWKFSIDRAKTRCGACDYDHKVISLSRHYVQDTSVPFSDIKNTILHEIAHALAGDEAGHGPYWKQVAQAIGCDGSVYNHVWRGTDKKYKIYCDCGKFNIQRHRVAPKFKGAVCASCNTLHVVVKKKKL